MRIVGQSTPLATRRIGLPRGDAKPLDLTVQALPLGAHNAGYRMFPVPSPPRDFERDARGVPRRDDDGKVMWREDITDPTWIASRDLAMRRQSAYLAWLSLRSDPDVTFDCAKDGLPNLEDPTIAARFFDEVWAELAAANFTRGDLDIITETAIVLSNVGPEALKIARESFSRREADSPNPSPSKAGAPANT